MTVLILNSGVGKRLGKITLDRTKGMVEVRSGESIFQNQVEKLVNCGLRRFVVTTGYLRDTFEKFAAGVFQAIEKARGIQLDYKFVYNELYDKTNYITSIHKAAEETRDDVILMHGDLIFTEKIIRDLLAEDGSRVVIDSTMPLPEKDFKARLDREGRVLEIDVTLKEDPAEAVSGRPATRLLACQPLYRLNKADWEKWLAAIDSFIQQGRDNCYAELALNTISQQIQLLGFDVRGQLCMEIDNIDDLNKIKEII